MVLRYSYFFNLANCSEMGSKMCCKYFWNIIEILFFIFNFQIISNNSKGASSYDEEPTYISEHLSTYILLKFQNVFGIFTSNIFTILYFRMILISRPTQSPQILLRISERSSKSTFTFRNVFRIRNCFGFWKTPPCR